jgi:hypothetical protein
MNQSISVPGGAKRAALRSEDYPFPVPATTSAKSAVGACQRLADMCDALAQTSLGSLYARGLDVAWYLLGEAAGLEGPAVLHGPVGKPRPAGNPPTPLVAADFVREVECPSPRQAERRGRFAATYSPTAVAALRLNMSASRT